MLVFCLLLFCFWHSLLIFNIQSAMFVYQDWNRFATRSFYSIIAVQFFEFKITKNNLWYLTIKWCLRLECVNWIIFRAASTSDLVRSVNLNYLQSSYPSPLIPAALPVTHWIALGLGCYIYIYSLSAKHSLKECDCWTWTRQWTPRD